MLAAATPALLIILASLFGWVAYRLWHGLRFRRALPLRGVVTAREPERLDSEVRGRQEELVHLEKAVQMKGLVVIGGWAGIGKTTLGRTLAGRLERPQVGIRLHRQGSPGFQRTGQL